MIHCGTQKGYRPVVTLGADNDHGAVFAGSPDHWQQGVRGSRDITGAERFDHDPLQLFCHDAVKQLKLDSGEHLDHADRDVLQVLQREGTPAGRKQYGCDSLKIF